MNQTDAIHASWVQRGRMYGGRDLLLQIFKFLGISFVIFLSFFHYITVHRVRLYDTDLLEAYKLNFYKRRLLKVRIARLGPFSTIPEDNVDV